MSLLYILSWWVLKGKGWCECRGVFLSWKDVNWGERWYGYVRCVGVFGEVDKWAWRGKGFEPSAVELAMDITHRYIAAAGGAV